MTRVLKVFLGTLISIVADLMVVSSVQGTMQVSITTFPSSITAGQEFEVSYQGTGLELNQNYNIKGLGGENFTEVDTWNNEWFQQNAAWASMPVFGSGADGSPSGTLKVRFDSETQSGAKDFKIRIKKSDSSDTNIDSLPVSISVSALPPTSTPESAHTSVPTLTPMSTPTSIPTVLKTSSPRPAATPKTQTPEVLGETVLDPTSLPTVTPLKKVENRNQSNFPFIAVVLVIIGLGFVGTSCYMAFHKTEETLV